MDEPKPLITEDEREDFELSEHGEWGTIDDSDETRLLLQATARRTLEERETVSIELSREDLIRLRARADEVGISYRSLISAVVHRYAARPSRT